MKNVEFFTYRRHRTFFRTSVSLAILFALALAVKTQQTNDLPKLLLISFDGFGWNFLSKFQDGELPNFERFMSSGVHVRWVENVFPTVTRPNHMTIVTGLYPESHGIVHNDFCDPLLVTGLHPESHGIVHNDFCDPLLGEFFPRPGKLMHNDTKWVDVGSEPVWVTNSKAGGGRKSGTIYWPLADVEIKGFVAERRAEGSWSVNLDMVNRTERVNLALDWLTDLKDEVNFVAIYLPEPDDVSHTYGPDSVEVRNEILKHDKLIGHLLDRMEEKGLTGKLNVIITADHGQISVYPEMQNYVHLENFLQQEWYTTQPVLGCQPMVNLWPRREHQEKVFEALRCRNYSCPHLHAAFKENSSDLQALHYTASSRIGPIVLFADPGWQLVTTANQFNAHKGQHGWDPRYSVDMYPFFIAHGPAFKRGLKNATPFHSTDIYALMCHILGLEPAPNNGSLKNVQHILADTEFNSSGSGSSSGSMSAISSGVAVGIAIVIAAIVIIVIVIVVKVRRSQNVTASYRRTFDRAGISDELLQKDMVILSDDEL